MTYIAGAYTALYKTLALGNVEQGFEIEWQATIEDIISDVFRGINDGVFQGVGVLIRTVLIEPNAAGVQSLLWPYNATLGVTGVTGRLMSSMAGPLVLTKCAGSVAQPTSLTFPKAIIWRDKVSSRYANQQRKIPVVIAALPYDASSASSVLGCNGATLFTVT